MRISQYIQQQRHDAGIMLVIYQLCQIKHLELLEIIAKPHLCKGSLAGIGYHG